jgi:hypothetical protein
METRESGGRKRRTKFWEDCLDAGEKEKGI